MPPTLVEAMVEGLRTSAMFATLPAMSRPLDQLWMAHNHTLLNLRLALYHAYLHKKPPRAAQFDLAVNSGLTLLSLFAEQLGTDQAIIRLTNGETDHISFQPRPFAASWNRTHALSPGALADPLTDPLTLNRQQPVMQTGDFLHLARKVALAFTHRNFPEEKATGTVTIEFRGDRRDTVRLVYRRASTTPGAQATAISEFQR